MRPWGCSWQLPQRALYSREAGVSAVATDGSTLPCASVNAGAADGDAAGSGIRAARAMASTGPLEIVFMIGTHVCSSAKLHCQVDTPR
mgnify:CR=1 FL=1